MTPNMLDASPRVVEVMKVAKGFTLGERLVLAKLLLDSIVSSEMDDEADWQRLSLASWEHDWDNPDDAVYDNWRELYGVPAR